MTKSELVQALSEYPDDAQIFIEYDDDSCIRVEGRFHVEWRDEMKPDKKGIYIDTTKI